MANSVIRPSWYVADGEATPESAYQDRRSFLKSLGLGGMAAMGIGCGVVQPEKGEAAVEVALPEAEDATTVAASYPPLPGFERNPKYADAGRTLTAERDATTFNNFYEFSLGKSGPARIAKGFRIEPYTLNIDGLVERPMKMDLGQLEQLGCEERVYRFRCVEAFAMTVPWLGVPLHKLLKHAGVKPEAKYVRFTSFHDPEHAPGQKNKSYNWPYYEGLRIDEAMNELTFVTTGLYGKRLLPQSGTPLRIVVPWKYGYKGPKSVVSMTLVDKEPSTFWNDANAREYRFFSNVDPKVPHPRWSQAMERYLGESQKNRPTQWYNGYGEQVAHLYDGMPRTLY